MSNFEQALRTFNTVQESQELLAQNLESAQDEYNALIDENNRLQDIIDSEAAQKKLDEESAREAIKDLAKINRHLNLELERVTNKHNGVAALLNVANVNLRELKALDAKGLAATNKTLKKSVADLKDRLANSEASRKEALSQHKILLKKRQNEGIVCSHADPETGNQLKMMPTLRVRKGNDYGGMEGTPVMEFYHKKSGIIRQGVLQSDGNMSWASAAGSMPTSMESKIAKLKIVEFCEANKIKLNVVS